MSDWTVRDTGNGNEKAFDSRAEAERAAEDMRAMGLDVDVVPPEGVATPATTDGEVNGDLTARDPQDRLVDRDWMLTPIKHQDGTESEDLNKRGTQVIAEVLGAYPSAELLEYEVGEEISHAVVKAWVVDPETGEQYAAHGEARSDERNVGRHEVIRQAETRAKKRTIKWVSASGAKILMDKPGQTDD